LAEATSAVAIAALRRVLQTFAAAIRAIAGAIQNLRLGERCIEETS
jgi:hypothetical protein